MTATVLIVDDSASVRQQVGMALKQSGFQIVEASDGQLGASRIAQGGIDCVICDVNMPNMNGIEMVQKVKSDPKNAGLPIVMLTTEGSKEMIAQAKAAGAKGWIVKPFKAELLIAAVEKLVSVPA
ncbi:response regulator [Neorhodopirellula pilleata]|uniref:Chemotaxis protein CheY n=1 Tax=Neorhodopirellula pilleata TaxID=2714738 RepID=A0A5C6B106_9BACT|nr:response regulator [Neorhodopirellula pilleata]TWU04074.1 Chemotaxis protein CheY [Neorhodopirellula pilleata]